MDPSLPVLIRYTRDGKSLRGSGLRVGGRFVLTADHCANGTGHRLVVDGSEYPASVHERSQSQKVDVAVLVAEDLPESDPVPCALVNRRTTAHLEDCQAIGFPSWRADPLTRSPVLAQTRGDIPTAQGRDISPPMLTFQITDPEARGHTVRGELDEATSKWAGMSGAGVVTSDDLLIGVVRSHAPIEGGQSLTVTPLEAINTLPTGVACRIWQALGVLDNAQLPIIPTFVEGLRRKPITVPPLAPGAVSREILLDPLINALLANDRSTIALVGPPGFGKTTLALQACRHPALSARFRDILFLTFGREPNITQLLARAFIDLTGTQPTAVAETELARRVLDHLVSRRGLLVLDDVWHSYPLEMLVRSSGPLALITTRDRTLVRDRATMVTVDLPLSAEETRSVLMPGRALNPEETAAIDNFGRRLHGWPLLVSLAAAWLRWPSDGQVGTPQTLNIADAMRQLDDGGVGAFDPIFDQGALPGQTRAVTVALQTSLSALPDDAQDKFGALAVFPPETALPTATIADLWDLPSAGAARLLRGLADRSLLRYDGRQAWLHSVVHDYLYGQLDHPASAHRALLQRWGDPLLITDRDRLAQVAWQMARSKSRSELLALISPRWLSHLLATSGSPTPFFADAETAARHAEECGEAAAAVRCWLAIVRVRETFASIRPEICKTLSALKEVDRALEYAALISSNNGYSSQDPYSGVVHGCANHDPIRAAQLARTLIRSPLDRARSLTDIAEAVAETRGDLSRSLAEEAANFARAQSRSDLYGHTFANAVAAVSMTDPAKGQTIAEAYIQELSVATYGLPEWQQESVAKWTREAVARGAARTDPDRAEKLTRSITGGPDPHILTLVAQSVAETQPERAQRLVEEARALLDERKDYRANEESERSALITVIAYFDLPRALNEVRSERKKTARAMRLADLAQSLRTRDPARARTLIREAIPLAQEWLKRSQRKYKQLLQKASEYGAPNPEYELHEFIQRAAFVDPAATLGLVRELTDESLRASALCQVAEQMPSDERAKALALVDEALRLPSRTNNPREPLSPTSWGRYLLKVLRILAGANPHEASRRVKITGRELPQLRLGAEGALAIGIARLNVGEAIRQVDRMGSSGNYQLGGIATEIARRDHNQARTLARRIDNPYSRQTALVAVGRAIAVEDPQSAERFARDELDLVDGAAIYADVGQAYALTDPQAAHRLVEELQSAAQAAPSPNARGQLRTAAAVTLARLDADRAAELARAVDQDSYGFYGWREGYGTSSAIAAVATALAATNVDRAEQLADTVSTKYSSDNTERRRALAAVAVASAQTGQIERALAIARKASDLEDGWSQPDSMATVLSAVARQNAITAYKEARSAPSALTRARLTASVAVAAAEASDPLTYALPKQSKHEALPTDLWPIVTQVFDAEPALLLATASARWAMYEADAEYIAGIFDAILEIATTWS